MSTESKVSYTGRDVDDDEIVAEIPVFLSKKLSKQIHLIQYPLQKNPHPSQPIGVRVKPRHCMMELDFDTPCNIQMNGLYEMASRTYTSQTIPVGTHMALGKLVAYSERNSENNNDNNNSNNNRMESKLAMHLVPLSRITQMRPSFSHIDEAMAETSAKTDDELKSQSNKLAVDASRKMISIKKRESERQASARKSSYGYKMASEDDEQWESLKICDEESLQAKQLIENIECPTADQSRNLFDLRELEKRSSSVSTNASTSKSGQTALNVNYLKTLNYLPPQDTLTVKKGSKLDESIATATSFGSGIDVLLARIVSKLVRLMRQGRPIPFSLLRDQFPTDEVKDNLLFIALGYCAVMVRGNFCLNSKLLSYPPAMAQARTFLLFMFHSMRTVYRERLSYVFGHDDTCDHDDDGDKVTPEIVEFLLEQLGKKTDDGWVLNVEDDEQYIENYSQSAFAHFQHWVKQSELFEPMISKYRNNGKGNDKGRT